MHFRHEGETIHRSSHAQLTEPVDFADEGTDAHDAHALFEKLKGRECVVMAHVGGRYADIKYAHDPMETAVEVHSAWGTFEWILHDALEKGYRVGVVANSDGHKGRPGACYPGASFFGSYGGLTCFLAERLDRDAIFAAMRRRRHYGTTGNRMILDVRAHTGADARVFLSDPAHGAAESYASRVMLMGDIAQVPHEATVDLQVDVIGSAPIERVDIFSGLEHLETYRPYAKADLGARVRLTYEGAEYRGRARTTTWDGTLSVTGNRIRSAAVFNNWNLDRGLKEQDTARLAWKAVTTGNYGGIDLWFEDGIAGALSFKTAHVEGTVDLASLGTEPKLFAAGGLGRSVGVQRLPETMKQDRAKLSRPVTVRDTGDTALYVRVQQEDGHRAWSSPIYLFR